MSTYRIDLDPQNVVNAMDTLMNVVQQARCGVTEFHYRGILVSILMDLDLVPLED